MFLAKPGVGDYDLSVKPIDMVDALAQAHDIGEDFVNYKGYNHPDYTANDIRFVRGLEAYYEKALYDDNYKDPFTGRKPSKEAIEAASNAINLFTWKISGKKSRANELLKKGEYLSLIHI